MLKSEPLGGLPNGSPTIAFAAECGYTLTAEDLDGLAEEDFQENGDKGVALDIDELEGVGGGMRIEVIKAPKY